MNNASVAAIVSLNILFAAPSVHAQNTLDADPLASMRPHHVALSVPNFEETVRWHEDKLGFKPLNVRTHASLKARGIFLERNGFLIEIFEREGSRRLTPPPSAVPDDLLSQGYKHIGFAVEDVDAVVAELQRRGVVVASPPEDVPELSLRLAFIRDNNGYLIELGQPIKRQ